MELQAPDGATVFLFFLLAPNPLIDYGCYTTRGTKLDRKGDLKQFWQCNYCKCDYFVLNVTRVKIHLSGEGAGIVACPKVRETKMII